MKKIIIAIDGHSSTGKSTFAKAIAARMGYTYLDSGAFYRVVTLFAIRNQWIGENIPLQADALEAHLNGLTISFTRNPQTGYNDACLNGQNVEVAIRGLEVSNCVSQIASLPFVRAFVDAQLHRLGEQKGIVMDGRDIGTAVFPQAEVKLFMTAPLRVRAERRLKELLAKGDHVTFEEVLDNVASRDYQDTHRATNPLVQAPDAIVLDNGRMTPEEQLIWFEKLLEAKWDIKLP